MTVVARSLLYRIFDFAMTPNKDLGRIQGLRPANCDLIKPFDALS